MEWKTVKLGDCLSKIIDNRGKTPKDLAASGHPLLEINAVSKDNKYPLYREAKKYVDDVVYSTWFRSGHPQYGDILVPTVGTLGAVAYVDRNDCCIAQNLIALRANADICDSAYIYYLLCNPQIVKRLLNLDIGAVQASIKVPHLLALEIPLPPLETQRRIAAILSSLDDKIENNNRINANLEAQAQALFKSWFVDFEPWEGTMPEDWKEGALGEIAEFKRGKGILGKETRPGNVPVVAGGMEPAYYHDTANTKAPVITISASGANAGYVRLYNEDIWASDCSWIDASSKNLLWVYCYLSINRHILRHAQTGAVQPHVKAKDVNAFEIIVPAQKVIEDFIEVVKPLFDQIANNQKESHRLATLRDTLLPKLMRGEISL